MTWRIHEGELPDMGERLQICERMAAVRSRGLVNAQELGEEVERLGDWREHVRAHPIPLVVAAAAAAYWLMPARRPEVKYVVPAQGSTAEVEEQKAKSTGGYVGVLLGFATSLAGNAIRNYVSQQVQTLVQGRDEHGSFVQRQASAHRH